MIEIARSFAADRVATQPEGWTVPNGSFAARVIGRVRAARASWTLAAPQAIPYTGAGDDGIGDDVDVLACVSFPDDSDVYERYVGLCARALGGGSTVASAGAWLTLSNGGGLQLKTGQIGNGTGPLTAYNYGIAQFEPGRWFWIRALLEGTRIRAKVWKYGESQPSAWHIDDDDYRYASEAASGYAGLYASAGGGNLRTDFRYFAAADAGVEVPTRPVRRRRVSTS